MQLFKSTIYWNSAKAKFKLSSNNMKPYRGNEYYLSGNIMFQRPDEKPLLAKRATWNRKMQLIYIYGVSNPGVEAAIFDYRNNKLHLHKN
ncbi:MAG: hypothetical protein AB8E15_06600 [Bdellovibrionales bacterium]